MATNTPPEPEFANAEEEARYLVQEVMTLAAAEPGSTEEIEDAIVALYSRLEPEFKARQLALKLLETLYATYGVPQDPFDPADELQSLAHEVSYPFIYRRTEGGEEYLDRRPVIRELAERLAGRARKPIETYEIITELRALGEKDPDRHLAIAIGNVLNRAGWQRVRSGVYAPPSRARRRTRE